MSFNRVVKDIAHRPDSVHAASLSDPPCCSWELHSVLGQPLDQPCTEGLGCMLNTVTIPARSGFALHIAPTLADLGCEPHAMPLPTPRSPGQCCMQLLS